MTLADFDFDVVQFDGLEWNRDGVMSEDDDE